MTSDTDPELSIVIPAYNEVRRLPATLDALARFLHEWGIDYEVLVVDDGSTDGTAQLTEGRGHRFSTLPLPQNRGKGAAVRTGMLQARGRVVAFLDADLSCGLDCVRSGYDALQAVGIEVVLGARNAVGSRIDSRRPWLRKLASAMFRGITHSLVSRQVRDCQAGFKMFRRTACQRIFSRATVDGFAFDAEVVLLMQRLGLPFAQVPVDFSRYGASTLSLGRHALPMLLDVLRIVVRARRGGYDTDPAAPAA